MADIEAKIVAQGDKIRELKTAKAAKDVIQPEVIFGFKVSNPFFVNLLIQIGGSIAGPQSGIQSGDRGRLETSRSSSQGSSS